MDFFFTRYGFCFSLRLCAEALTRGPGGLQPARDTHSCKETTFECSACSSSSHNNQNSCTSDALQSNMQHDKIGRFVSGGAYEGKQNRLQIPISEPIISVQISTKIEIISTTIGGTSENSSDLSLGRRPMSESEEFFEVPPLIIEI